MVSPSFSDTPESQSAAKLPGAVQHLIALLAGGTMFLGFAPYGLWYVALLSLTIFAALCRAERSPKSFFLLALTFNFGIFAVGVHWLFVSIHTHGLVPAPLAVIFTGAFAFLNAFVSSLPWLAVPKIAHTPQSRLLVFPAIWLLGEWLRSWVLTGFPWLFLGHAHIHTPLAGWMPILGAIGVGLMVSLTAYAFLSLVTLQSLRAKACHAVLLIVIWGGGFALDKVEWTTPLNQPVSATLVQPDVALTDKWLPERRQDILNALEGTSREHWRNNLVIWPEAALPFVGEAAESYLQDMEKLIESENAAFITGFLTYSSEEQRYYNTVGGVGQAGGQYQKQRLVPFGEYVPLESWLRGLMNFFDMPMSVISAGKHDQDPLYFTQNGHRYTVSPAICYEIAYAPLVAKLTSDANLIVTLSNDAWFGESIGPKQHMEIAQIRALENRKPLLRVTNNGITASVDHRGHLLDMLPQFTTDSLKTEIQPMVGKTWFNFAGHWTALMLTLAILTLSYGWRKRSLQSPQKVG